MLGKKVSGFSFIEILLVIAIMALVLTVAVPNFMNRMPLYKQKAFVTQLNGCMSEAWQNGLKTQKVQKIMFNFDKREVTVEEETDTYDHEGKRMYKPVTLYYVPKVAWPDTFEMSEFFVQGKDELAVRGKNGTTDNVWFFITPGGVAQEVVINIFDTRTASSVSSGRPVSLVNNPFSVQFKAYDEFQKPS